MTTDLAQKKGHKAVIAWLFFCAGLVFLMVIVGAITRLTESGLSMVEWRPLLGALPPLNEGEWNRVFELYKASPQFEKQHFWMELHDFKQIFFWEWFHRFLGRFVGIAFALPLLWFAVRRQIPKGYGLKFLGLLCLGGGQGLMGWYMVQSGLIDNPAVSHYRLAAHLSLAFLIFCLLLWFALTLKQPHNIAHKNTDRSVFFPLFIHGLVALVVLTLTILWGAYTAGLDAGLVYNEHFPKMTDESWIPPTISQHQPYWAAFFETPEGVQFIHRWLAITTVITILSLWVHSMKRGIKTPWIHALAVFALVQMTLGIVTLLTGVNLHVAVTHQAGALTLLALLAVNLRQFKA